MSNIAVQPSLGNSLNLCKESSQTTKTTSLTIKQSNKQMNKNSNKCINKCYQLSNNKINNNTKNIMHKNNSTKKISGSCDSNWFKKNSKKTNATDKLELSSTSLSPSILPPLAATANDCDKKNFVRFTSSSNNQTSSLSSLCSFLTYDFVCDSDSFTSVQFKVVQKTSSASLFQLEGEETNRRHLKTRVKSKAFESQNCRTFYNRRRNEFLSRYGFYRISLFCLQLSAILFSFISNFGIVLASNSINDLNARSKSGSTAFGDDSTFGHFTHTWAVHIPKGEENNLADKVARDHGFVNLGKIFDDHYHFAHHKVSKRSLSAADTHQSRLDEDQRVHWSRQQRAKSRQKRDFMRIRPSRTSPRALSLVDAVILNDPKWPQMWYLNRGGGLDMNVIPAWKEGITGKGIVVTILDDGLESDHPDIEHNYDPLASYDVNSHDNDPMPHYDMTDSNRHGTRCAGEVAATANNSICAVGIAFGASVGGVRMLDGDVTDAVEARSLSLNPQHIDIYSASWGPDDDGKTVDGPGELASRAFIEGVTKGRSGKGSIFIWASGNGGRELDNCNCDGYTNSIWTLSISSATEDGHVPWYSEKCSSTLATTYSSGSQGEKQVVTTDLHHSCTVSHTGTSASAPLAAGIAALVLESNRNLTWRDLQHIVVRTAKPANLKDPTWSKNGVGRRISHSFGYGLMDAAAMVRVARSWKTVPEQQRCEINAPHVDKTIPAEGYITLQLAVKHCMSVNYLEHVQAKITLTSQRRGDIQLFLRSPAGTRVTLLTNRMHDNSRTGFNQWPFMSVHTWGESPHGNWQLEIHNEGRFKAQITQWDLIFYGTDIPAQPEDAVHLNSGKYNSFGSEMEHNDIEFDASGQWHNMQQVGESAVKSHDRTNEACIKSTIDQKCLACAPPTFLFNYRCYDACPRHTFVITLNLDATESHIEHINDNGINKSTEPDEQLLSVDKRSRFREIVTDAPSIKTENRECHICDSSCFDCYGPFNSQCSSCNPGGQLRKYRNETFCYNFSERSTKNANGENLNNGFFEVNPKTTSQKLILSAALLVVFIVLIIIFIIYRHRVAQSFGISPVMKSKAQYKYDRVALLTENEAETEATLEEQNHEQNLNYSVEHTNVDSESENEVDIFIINNEKS